MAELYSSHNLTFLVRADRFHINKLQKLSIVQAYIKVFDITSDQAEEIAEMIQGYAYAFQLIGDFMYELSTGKNFEESWNYTKLAFKDTFFNQAYDVISHELTEIDFQFLYEMSKIIILVQLLKKWVKASYT
ncbi:hypothetical protein [Lactobacillus johnsonii]|uniref:hypothetical protein n=1 Tax=Lactobacillus johnsonii TaxID=33959 RepID=UPI001F5681E8|nr:hypothetical protein [Lactobacillus johnsonii]